MVHLSTVVIAALAIVPALATQVSDFEARDTQDLDVRGTKSTRSFDDFDLEVRDKSKKKRRNANRQNQNQRQQPQRQSTGLSTSAGRLLGTTINTAINGGGERRAFFDEEDLEVREGEKRRRRRRSRKQRLQAQPQTTEGGEQNAGTTRDLEDFDLEARFDFEDLEFEARMDSEDLDLEARDKSKKKRKNANRQNQNQRQQPQRQSTGLSTSAGRLLGTTINTAINGGGERRSFFDEEDLEAREGERRRRRRRSRKQRVQAQPQTTEGGEQTAGSTRDFDDVDLEARTRRQGLSASAGRFVGSTIHSAVNGGERRDFVDEDGLDARNNESKRRRRRARKQRKQQQQQPQTTEGQTTGSGETREFVDEDFMVEAREIDELD